MMQLSRVWTKSLMVVIATILALAISMAVGSSLAQAAGPSPRLDAQIYTGWAYLANNADIPAFKWSATGWSKTTFKPGQTGWAVPYATGWHWFYRGKAWYALQSKYMSPWRCEASAVSATWIDKRMPIYHYNSDKSTSYGIAEAQTVAPLVCENTFRNAYEAPGTTYCLEYTCGPDHFSLVRTPALPACYLPTTPTTAACTNAEPATGWPTVTGYVKMPSGGYYYD